MRAMVAAALVLGAAGSAAAGPRVRLAVDGACPTEADVRAALPAADDGADAPIAIDVVAGTGGAAVTLTAGARVEHRWIAGHDCAALAGAVAALADAWLIELAAAPLPPPAAPPPAPPSAPPPAAPGVTPAAPASARATPRWFLGASRGLVFASDAARAGTTRIDGAWRSGWRATRVRLTFDWGDAAALDGDASASTARQPWTLAATAGWRSGGRAWLEGAAGAGVVVSRVDAIMGGAVRVHPAAVARAGGGLELGLGVSLRAEVEAEFLPITDRYLVAGGAVGTSPWANLVAGLGLDVALGAR